VSGFKVPVTEVNIVARTEPGVSLHLLVNQAVMKKDELISGEQNIGIL
jgi:hypothetical protein